MSEVMSYSATKFTRDFPLAQDDAREHGVVKVQSHNRLVGAFLSPSEYANYERLKKREREILKVGQLPEDVVTDLEAALDAAEY